MKKEELKISGISCASCVQKIEKKLNSLEGVKTASVNLATEKANIVFLEESINSNQLIDEIKKLGFGAEKFETITQDEEEALKNEELKKMNRR